MSSTGVVDEEVIVVTGTRSESPRAASPVTTEVISRKRLEESGVQTVSEALAQRPGLWVDPGLGGSTGLTIQGLGPQYSAILVDGARQIGRTDGVLDLDRFGVEDLEQIEIVRGPSSVLYGSDALGGVVNMISRTPRDGIGLDALARVDGRLGYEGRARVAYGRGGIAGSLTGSYREAPALGAGDDPDNPLETTFDAYKDAHVSGHAIHRRSEAWRFDAGADYLRRDLRGVDQQGAVLDHRHLIESATMQAGAQWSSARTMVRIDADTSLYRDQSLVDQRLSDQLDRYEVTDENLVEARAQLGRSIGRHRAVIGGEVLREALESDRLSEPGERTRAAVYLQDEWRLGATDQIIAVPGARLDVDTQFGNHVTPRIAARWQLDERSVVRGSVGMGYRAPSFKELLLDFKNPSAGYTVEGNPDLRPETSISVQAGGEWQARPWLWLAADAYYNRIREMIAIVEMGSLMFSYDNIARARTAGVELYAIATRGRAGLELGYALTRTRDLDEDRPLDGIPAQRFTATVRWRDPGEGLDAFAALVVTGHRPFYSDNAQVGMSLPTTGLTLTDRRFEVRARIGKRFRSGLGGFLGIDNLLDEGDTKYNRTLPRTVYAGVEVHR